MQYARENDLRDHMIMILSVSIAFKSLFQTSTLSTNANDTALQLNDRHGIKTCFTLIFFIRFVSQNRNNTPIYHFTLNVYYGKLTQISHIE